MKTPSDELFKLIKSLKSHEKRLFKQYYRHNSGSVAYLKLFDAIDDLSRYNEKKVAPLFNKKKGVNAIKGIKSYLLEAILDFLEHHYCDYSIEIQVQRLMQRTEILFEKRQLPAAKKQVEKAEKLAVENHCYALLPGVLGWKRKIITNSPDFAASDTCYNDCYLRELHYMDWHKNMVEYQNIEVQVKRLSAVQFKNTNSKTITELKALLKNPFLKQEEKALSFPAKVMYCRILGDIFLLLNNPEKSRRCFQRAIDYSGQAGLTVSERLMLFSKLMMPLSTLKKNDELLLVKDAAGELIQSMLKKLQTTGVYTPYLSFMNNYIDYHISVLNLDEALSASDEIQGLIEKQANTQSFAVYYFNRVLICLFLTDYHKALHCAKKVLTKEKKGIRKELMAGVKILSLVVHYELGNIDILPYLCRSYARYSGKQQQQNEAVNVLLRFFSKTIPEETEKKRINITKQDRIKLFIALKKQLEECKTENRSAYVFAEFDFISWAESKIENRPLIDVLREKAGLAEG